jgi:hypothetical protein
MTTPDEHRAQWQDDEELPIEELARRQGVKPITSVDQLGQPGLWESDEEYCWPCSPPTSTPTDPPPPA